jgi:Tol biopolymer transport system component
VSRVRRVAVPLALLCLWPLLAACGTIEVRVERTPSPLPTSTPTPSPLPPFSDACQGYLDLLLTTAEVQQPVAATAYTCGGLSVDSTGQSAPQAAAFTIRQGTALHLEPGTAGSPTAIEVRLYPGAGIEATFMRWPEELPDPVEPVERAEIEVADPNTYTPQAAPGTYSLVIRIQWADEVDVFYATSFALVESSTPTPTPTSSPPTPAAGPVEPPAGLVYRLEDALWLVDADGHPVQVADHPHAVLSPDGSELIRYDAADGEFWRIDRSTGKRVNLTRTPGRMECCFRWWPARPDVVLFSSINPAAPRHTPGPMGYLTAVNVDGTDYRVLDDVHDLFASEFAPSPDGETIAYGGGNAGWLYRWGNGVEAFDPAEYGLIGVSSPEIGSPAWSPDSARLAWVVDLELDGQSEEHYAIAVFDLAARTARVLHPYAAFLRAAWPPAPVWSPDGRWLAFIAWAQDPEEGGVWVVQVDGSREEEVYLGPGDRPNWSPDGKWLAFNRTEDDTTAGIYVAEAGTWEPRPVDLPSGAHVVNWIESAAPAPSEPTPTAVPTSPPEATPSGQAPEIVSFEVMPKEVAPGDVVTLRWEARGDRATLCPSARFTLFDESDCREAPVSGSTTFTIPQDVGGNPFIDWILRVEASGVAEPAVWQVTVALKCDRTWFFSDEPQAGICPREPVETSAAIQRFERGTMFWLQALGRYVILSETPDADEGTQGRVTYVSDPLDVIEDTSASVEAPEGSYAPKSGFGLIWRGDVRGVPGYREALGWALAPEFGYEATWQCDDAIPSGGRSWQTCYLAGPTEEVYVLDPLDRWYVLEQSGAK